jgi:MOSC domain-containing protein
MFMALSIRDLYVYPLKSAAGIRMEAVELDAFGFAGDRRWMIVDDAGRFLSQRELPRLSLLRAQPDGPHLRLDMPGLSTLTVTAPGPSAARVPVTIWDDRCEAIEAHDDTRAWLRDALGVACRLVYAPDDMRRLVDRTYANSDEQVGFADAFPILVIGDGSLDDLNARLTAKGEPAVPMNRFRPNIVVSGAAPYAEDGWQRVAVGHGDRPLHLDIVKPCARCVTVTVDQAKGIAGKEPLTTLSTYRRHNGKVYFGQNVIHRGIGTLRVGDTIRVIAD